MTLAMSSNWSIISAHLQATAKYCYLHRMNMLLATAYLFSKYFRQLLLLVMGFKVTRCLVVSPGHVITYIQFHSVFGRFPRVAKTVRIYYPLLFKMDFENQMRATQIQNFHWVKLAQCDRLLYAMKYPLLALPTIGQSSCECVVDIQLF